MRPVLLAFACISNTTSLKAQIEPTIYMPGKGVRRLVMELENQNYLACIAYLEEQWDQYFPQVPMDLVFLDDRFNALYKQDQRFGDILIVFSVLAIFIGILGLYGLASFLSIQRSMEIGIRKVLGASQSQILLLFFRGFIQLLAIAGVLGFPIAYYFMSSWLDNYAYRIDFPWMIPILSLGLIMFLALLTVGYQTLKIARLNPARTLKYE